MLIHQVGYRLPSTQFLRSNRINRDVMYDFLVENSVLREDATREIEETLTDVARRDLVGVADLRALSTPLAKGIGATTYEFDRITPVGEASQGMSILNLGDRDLVSHDRTAVPVPVTASQFQLDARSIAAGDGVDMTNLEEHTRAVAEKLEDTLFNGSTVVLGANTLPGYTDVSCRSQITSTSWAGLTPGSFTTCITEILTARAALRDDGFTGPYTLYVPANWDAVLDEDYKAESDRTIRERLLAINGVSRIEVAPALADDNAVLVQMTRSVVQMPIGQDITTVTWGEYGDLARNWVVLAVLSFAIKCAWARAPLSNGTLPALSTATGVAHLS